MDRKTLLLNASYEVISFLPERRALKLLINDKVEVIHNWGEDVSWSSANLKYPATIRLKNHVKRNFFNLNFSRKALVRRDAGICQYCSKKLSPSQISVDHVVPRAQHGETSFINCVIACKPCNNKKADKTPEEAGMTLIRKPVPASFSAATYIPDHQDVWHDEWDDFVRVK